MSKDECGGWIVVDGLCSAGAAQAQALGMASDRHGHVVVATARADSSAYYHVVECGMLMAAGATRCVDSAEMICRRRGVSSALISSEQLYGALARSTLSPAMHCRCSDTPPTALSSASFAFLAVLSQLYVKIVNDRS